MSQVRDALLHFRFVPVAHLPENRAPSRHLFAAVSGNALSAKNARDLVGGKLSAVVFGQHGQICRHSLECGSGRAIAFSVLAVAGCTISFEHFLAGGRIRCRRRDLFNFGFLFLSERNKRNAETEGEKPNEKTLKRHTTSLLNAQ